MNGTRAQIAGSGVASDYAQRLLADLEIPTHASPGPADPQPALAWARSGAMALCGWPDALPRVPSGALACAAEGVGRALRALGGPAPSDCAALLAERAAWAGFQRRGRSSANGHCRLLRAADGWGALQLARPDDVQALSAWLETPSDPELEAWEWVRRELARRPLAGLEQRAAWLGLPFAIAGPVQSRPWLRLLARGPSGPTPDRLPRVLDFSSLWAGPLCGALLVEAGCEVTKIESRNRPDGARGGPAGFFARLNANKRSCVLDFANATDLDRMHALVAEADVVIEASRPRALAQLGLDAERFVEDRPGRVWLSITGYGREDPPPGRIAFGDDAAVAAGCAQAVADASGPLFCADALADPLTGLHAALAVWAQWRHGASALLDLSLRDVCSHALAFAATGDFEVLGTPNDARVRVDGAEQPVEAPRVAC